MIDVSKIPNTVNQATFTKSGAKYDNVLWDRIILDSTVDDPTFFDVGQGENFPGTNTRKNRSDTNLKGKGLPTAMSFWVFGFALKYFAIAERTVAQLVLIDDFFRNTSWEFLIDGKTAYGQGTLDYIMGAPTQIQLTLAAGSNYAYQNIGVTKGFLPLNAPIPLAKLTDFQVQLNMDNGINAGLDGDLLKWELVGIENRKAL